MLAVKISGRCRLSFLALDSFLRLLLLTLGLEGLAMRDLFLDGPAVFFASFRRALFPVTWRCAGPLLFRMPEGARLRCFADLLPVIGIVVIVI